MDVKQQKKKKKKKLYSRSQKLCKRRDVGSSSLILSPYDLCGRKATEEEEEEEEEEVVQESCVKVEVAVLGSPSLIVRKVPVDVKQR